MTVRRINQRFPYIGIAQHIIQRGNNRQAVFFTDDDDSLYLEGSSEVRHDCAIHAYVLMTSHVHLPVMPARADGFVQLMQSIGRRRRPSIRDTPCPASG